MTTMEAILYTRRGCCLCDEAKRVLEAHGLPVHEIDIDSESGLRERYNDSVPIVMIDGHERFRGRIEPRLLARLLASRSAADT